MNLLTAFNDHFIAFVDDFQSVFPDDVDILTAKNSFLIVRKTNPKLIIKIWDKCVNDPYQTEIENGNIDFFINKDYTQDLLNYDNGGKIIESINRLRDPIRKMTPPDQQKTIKYLQNLMKLSLLYKKSA